MSGFTPGPWKVEREAVVNDHAYRITHDGGRTLGGLSLDPKNHESDARLIATAPDLKAENERLRDAAHRLAMLALQSDRYAEDGEYGDAVRAVFDIVGTLPQPEPVR